MLEAYFYLRLLLIPIYGEEERYEVWPSFKDIIYLQGQMGQMWSSEHAVKQHSSYNDLAL
jgi:hypothetical protein